ncbi:MAG: DNA-processing protein DprA, partial [Lachnospiraceae bacterium]|nr:DNA-processing protein DprA [Lachnospiraceae bacterium]
QPYSYNFPQRNRLISALADIVLVVEARRKSGSLITVDFALDQGRTVFAVPGRVGDALSDGCNYLIAQGAGIAWSPEALLEELAVKETMASYARKARADHARRLAESLPGLDAAVRGKDGVLHVHRQESLQLTLKEEDLSENARLLLPHLTSDPKGAEELNAETGMEPARIMDGLIELALSGLCEELGRGRFVKIAQNSGAKL